MNKIIFQNRIFVWAIFIAIFIAIFSWWAATLFSIEEANQALYLGVSRMRPQFIRSENVSSWKIYSDNKIGFEFRIPPDGIVDSQDASRINLAVAPGTTLNEKYLLVQTTENTGRCEKNAGGVIQKKEAVAIHGLQFTKYTASDAAMGNVYKTTAFITEKDGKCIILSFIFHSINPGMLNNPPPPFDSEEEYKIVDQILNTFQYSDTSSWKTYRNEKYGFEMKYPSGWGQQQNDNLLLDVVSPWKESVPVDCGHGADCNPPDFLNLQIYLIGSFDFQSHIASDKLDKVFTMQNHKIYKTLYCPDNCIGAYVDLDEEHFLWFRIEHGFKVENEVQQKLADILSTLKFFEPKAQ